MSNNLKTVYLYGSLKKRFGESFQLDVNTPVKAVKALCHLLPDFKSEFRKYDYSVIKGTLGKGWVLGEETVSMQFGKNENEIHFIPQVAGSKKGGLGKIIAGVVLIGLAFSGAGAGLAGFLGMSTTKLAIMGGILALGGLSQMNAKTPKFTFDKMEPAERRPSFIFNGPENTTEQGLPIPVIYGIMRVGSQVVSSGQDTDQI